MREVQHESRLRVDLDDHPYLFLDFAYLDPHSEKAMCTFANAWGLLGDEDPVHLDDGRWAEPISFWIYSANEMAEAVGLWLVLREENAEALAVRADLEKREGHTYFLDTPPEGAGYADFDYSIRRIPAPWRIAKGSIS
ncbi:MAG: hypothetical protein IIC53_07185 [Proteobacteria bacterium]|nr:hypothetical protein [Pseudomonadota bacterium]